MNSETANPMLQQPKDRNLKIPNPTSRKPELERSKEADSCILIWLVFKIMVPFWLA